MDEAISQQNPRLLAIVFDALNLKKKEKIERNKLRVLSRLNDVPDFYTEVHWEIQSSWIPFLNKIAPSDTFQIWKVGSSIRVDFSLVGFSKLQTKRRHMRILFRDGKTASDEYPDIDTLLVNQDRQLVVNPLEDLDSEEKLAVLTDIMNADPVQNELNVVGQKWSELTTWMGQAQRETVNGFDCRRYKVQVEAQVRQKRKIVKKFDQTYDQYFGPQVLVEESKIDTECVRLTKDEVRTIESQLWLSEKFPLKF
jgi:hypothetical protein